MDRLDTVDVARTDLSAQREALGSELAEAAERVLASGQFILGPEVQSFEREFAAYTGAPECVTTGSGTDAIRLVLEAYGIGPGDEVVTVSHTYAATAFAIAATGATPVLVDVDANTYTMDVDRAAAAIGPATRALLPVHIYGRSAELGPLRDLADERDLLLVEDACQAHGAAYFGRATGTVGHAGCFSFYPTKNLGAYGDGGAVVTGDAELAGKLRLLRNVGSDDGRIHKIAAGSSRLDELQAAFLRVKLPHLDRWNEARRTLAAAYEERLRDVPVVTPADGPPGAHVFHLYVIRTPRRDDLRRHLAAGGVETGIHYPVPIHRQPAWTQRLPAARLPVTERLADEILSLPMYPELGEAGVARVADLVREFFQRQAP